MYNTFRATTGLVKPSMLLESVNLGKGRKKPRIQGLKEKTTEVLR